MFVLGKGGVGRSTVAAALGSALGRRGEKVLVVEWTIAEAIAPWFGKPAAGSSPCDVAPGLAVMNYSLDEALRAYFVDHLHLGPFYRRVVAGQHVKRLIAAAPGIAELLFLGQLYWLTTLAEAEAGLHYDRIVVDAPATGHGASLLDLPTTLAAVGASGLLALEIERVVKMMADPFQVGAWIVALPEDLAVEETLELTPRVREDLGRPPLAVFVNRSTAGMVSESAAPPGWLGPLRASREARETLVAIRAELGKRVGREGRLRQALAGATEWGVFSLEEQLAREEDATPAAVVAALSRALEARIQGGL